MALTRRQFLKRAGISAAGSFVGPALMRNPLLRKAMADAFGDRYLIVIFLDGGNDGLNTVVPYADGMTGALRDRYTVVRTTGAGGLQLSEVDLDATTIGTCPGTGTALALHPGFTGFKTLYDAGKLAVIQGCGYPSYNLSHDESASFWATGDPFGLIGTNTGWVGRYLEETGYGGNDISSVNIRSKIAREFIQYSTNVLAFSRLSNFTFPYDNISFSDRTAKNTAFGALYTQALSSPELAMSFVGSVGGATLNASQIYPQLNNIYTTSQTYPNTSTANDLKEIAKIINGVEQGYDPIVTARYFELANGGYDTHSNQGAATGSHFNLHKEVGDAILTFYNDLVALGDSLTPPVPLEDKVTIVIWSEFSRRITQNDSGTDHGSQGPMFVIGGKVNGGVYGNHPDINTLDGNGNTSYSQAAGNYRSTDMRDVFGTILNRWLGMADPSLVFPLDTGGTAATRWKSANFDMGFLPPFV